MLHILARYIFPDQPINRYADLLAPYAILSLMFFFKHFPQILSIWLPISLAVIAVNAFAYILCQQVLRQSANDPQVQLSQDIAAALSQGEPLQSIGQLTPVPIDTSLATFVMVFDDQGKTLVAQARLNHENPSLPPGIFNYVRDHGEDRITWQPQPGVRLALVVNRFSNPTQSGFVAVGRSLKEVERRTDQLFKLTVIGSLAINIAIYIYLVFQRYLVNKLYYR
jgi:hypothetical protein